MRTTCIIYGLLLMVVLDIPSSFVIGPAVSDTNTPSLTKVGSKTPILNFFVGAETYPKQFVVQQKGPVRGTSRANR